MTNRKQTSLEHQAVAHMARNLAEIHDELAALTSAGHFDESLLELQGRRSWRLMEVLGEALNEMDAVTEEDMAFVSPIFEAGRQMREGRYDD